MRRDRILIVDPNPLDGAALRAALCESGFDAVEATTADGAFGLVPSFQPAAVLVDAALPDLDPAGFVGRLRAMRSFPLQERKSRRSPRGKRPAAFVPAT